MTKEWRATQGQKSSATRLRLFAAIAWVVAIAAEIAGVVMLRQHKFDHGNLPLLVGLLVAIAVFAIAGNLMWKAANKHDPASKADGFRFFVQNQLGAIITLIAFLPLIVLIFMDKDMDPKNKKIVDWYERVMGMRYTTAFAEDKVPSTGEDDPYMHVFLDCGGGNVLAFFELPNQPEMGKDPNTPAWVQHIAFEVEDEAALQAAKAHLEAEGVDVLGPTYHGIFRSIYFFDPNGHRLELACNIGTAEQYAELADLAPVMLEEWSQTKRAPRHAEWLHKDPATA